MKKSELKKLISPIVKECVKESVQEILLESGLLSSIISEVVSGMQANIIVESKKPINENKQINKVEKSGEPLALRKMRESRERMTKVFGNTTEEEKVAPDNAKGILIGGVDIFEGTKPLNESERKNDAGLKIDNIFSEEVLKRMNKTLKGGRS